MTGELTKAYEEAALFFYKGGIVDEDECRDILHRIWAKGEDKPEEKSKWIDDADCYICPRCGQEVSHMMPVCPNCGKKFAGEYRRMEG